MKRKLTSLRPLSWQGLVCTVVILLTTSLANAQNFTSHSSASHLGNECYELVPDATSRKGLIWNKTKMNLLTPFDIVVSAYFGSKDALGADGIVFIMQRDSRGTSAIGSHGGQLAINGIDPSFLVEFDTWDNKPGDNYPDIPDDHVDVFKDGNIHNSLINGAKSIGYNIEDDACHLLRFTWDPVMSHFRAYIDDMNTPVVDMYYNIIHHVFDGDPTNIWWGFTAATGDKTNTHKLAPLITRLSDREIFYCNGSQTLSVEGSGNFTWAASPGLSGTLSCTTCANPTVTPTGTGYYTVTANVGCNDTVMGQCSYTDTVWVKDSCCKTCGDFFNPMHPASSFQLVNSLGPDGDSACCYRIDLFNPHLVAPPKYLCSYYGIRAYKLGDTNKVVNYFNDQIDLKNMWGNIWSNFDHSVVEFCLDRSEFVNGKYTMRFEFIDKLGNVICDTLTHTFDECALPPPTGPCCDSVCNDVIVNGDFESTGSPGFTTDYELRDSTFNSSGDVAVVNDASKSNPAFVGTGDGNFLVVDGSTTPNQSFWKQTVSVTPNTDYCISFWILNVVNNPNEPAIQLKINGTPLVLSAANDTIDTTAVSSSFGEGWVKVCAKWNSGSNTSITLEMLNLSTSFAGNDFAIDNIVFGEECTTTYKRALSDESPLDESVEFELIGNSPNPFTGQTQFHYVLPDKADVMISVYSMYGRKVAVIKGNGQAAGHQSLKLDAAGLAPGVYLYKVEVATKNHHYRSLKRMMISD